MSYWGKDKKRKKQSVSSIDLRFVDAKVGENDSLEGGSQAPSHFVS